MHNQMGILVHIKREHNSQEISKILRYVKYSNVGDDRWHGILSLSAEGNIW